MKKSFKIILGTVGVLFILALIAPWLITLNQYKSLIQQKALAATGREVLVNGDIRLGLLPSPYARITDVVVTNPKGAVSKDFATVKSIDVGVALFPLLSGKTQITHITVTEPAITLETLADGSNNWQFNPPEKTAAEVAAESKTSSASNLSIDDLTIEKAFIRVVDVPNKSQQTIGPIDGTFNIASMQGPIDGKGSITVLENLPIKFEAKVDAFPTEENATIPFALSLNVLNKAATVDFKGTAQKGEAISAKVESAVAIPDLEKILAAVSKDNKAPSLPSYLQGKAGLNGMVEYADNQVKIDNMVIRSGGMEISASLLANLKDKKSVTLDLGNVVLPPEAAIEAKAKATSSSAPTETLAKTLENTFASAVGFLDTDLPKSPMDFIITASQLPLPGQPILRDVRIAASSTPNGVTIQNVEAKLPGNTFIQLQADLPARKDGKIDHAVLNTKFSTQNLQAALGKEGNSSPSPINLQTTATLTRENLHLAPFQVSQNNQSVQADILYNPKSEEALVIGIKGSALDLDGFMGKPSTETKTAAPEKDKGKTAVASSDPLAMLKGLKARINADLGSVTYQHKTARDITVQSNVSDKGFVLQQARIGDLGGMVITAQGKVDQLSPLKNAAFTAQASSPNLSQTLKALGNANAQNLGASKFDAQINGDANNLKIGLNGTIDQGKVAVNGTANNLNTSPAFSGVIDISHPETATIVRNFGGLKPTVSLGAFALKTNLTYGADTLKANDLSIKLGSAGTLQGHINVVPDKNGRKIDADLKADKLALAALMGDDTTTNSATVDTSKPKPTNEGWSKEPINLSSLRNLNGNANIEIGELLYQKFIVKNFKTTVGFANNLVSLTALKGNLFDAGNFSISGQLAPGAENQAHRGDFSITVDKTDAPKLFVALGSKPFNKGTLDLNQKISFNGASPYAIINSLNGDGQFKITDGIVNGIDLDGLAAKLDRPNSLSDFAAIIDQARAGGETAIGDVVIPVAIRNGVVQVQNTTIKTQKTAMAMGGTVTLPSKTVDLTGQITFTEQRNLPALALIVKGPMSDPQKSFDTRSFTSFYAQKATEKLQEKVQDKLGKFLGLPKEQPAAPTPAAPATNEAAPIAPSTTAPVAPTAPTAPSAAPKPTAKQQKDEALKQLGGQMLNNLFGGQPK